VRSLLLSPTCVVGLRLLRSTSALLSVYSPELGRSATPNLSHHHPDVSLRRRLPRLLRIQGRDPQWPPVLHTRVLPRLWHVQAPQIWLWWLVLSFAVLRSRTDWPLHESSAYTHPSQYIQSGRYPRGVVPGGYSRGVVSGGYSQAMVPRNFVGGGYPGYSSGYAYGTGYHVGAQQVIPVSSAMVSSRSFLSSPIALPRHRPHHTAAALPRHHWLTCHLEHRVHLGLHCRDNIFSSA
jgi:hypothetical protein